MKGTVIFRAADMYISLSDWAIAVAMGQGRILQGKMYIVSKGDNGTIIFVPIRILRGH
jgi:hypothetical protein